MVAKKRSIGLARGSDRERTRSRTDRLSSRFRQSWLDARDQLLSELCAHPGIIGLVRTLGYRRREAGLHLRIRRALHVGLDPVSWLVQGPARIRQRQGSLGILPRGMERAV